MIVVTGAAGFIGSNVVAALNERGHTDIAVCDWLGQDQVWFSQAAKKEMRSPRAFLVAHFFNHQTHHRGQAHAMITAAGEGTGDTDLILLV